MEEIRLTPLELKEAIDIGKLIGGGLTSKLFTYKGRIIKLDEQLYRYLKINSPSSATEVIKDRYKWGKQDFNSREQIEELSKRQPFIRPKVPEGIVVIKDTDSNINDVSPGIIIPPFEGYENLKRVPPNEYKRILILLRKVFDDIRELADFEIAQEDLYHDDNGKYPNDPVFDYNVIQKGKDAQIIDLSGPCVKVGKDFTNADRMYMEFAALLNHYYRANGLQPIYEENSDLDEHKLKEMLDEFEKQTKNK